MGAYIINVPSTVDRIIYTNVDPMNGKTYIASYSVDDLTPYTEPDLEQVRKEAYEKGRKDVETQFCSYDACKNRQEEYQRGLADAWDAARKIAHCALWDDYRTDSGKLSVYTGDVLDYYTASEAIEKIRQYEQEQDRQARIEYNFDEIKDVLETTAKECNVSLDEIAEVLEKMRGEQDG